MSRADEHMPLWPKRWGETQTATRGFRSHAKTARRTHTSSDTTHVAPRARPSGQLHPNSTCQTSGCSHSSATATAAVSAPARRSPPRHPPPRPSLATPDLEVGVCASPQQRRHRAHMAIDGCPNQGREPIVVLSPQRPKQRQRRAAAESGAAEPRRRAAGHGVGWEGGWGRASGGSPGVGARPRPCPCSASYLLRSSGVQNSRERAFPSNWPPETALAGHGTERGALTDGVFRSVQK